MIVIKINEGKFNLEEKKNYRIITVDYRMAVEHHQLTETQSQSK